MVAWRIERAIVKQLYEQAQATRWSLSIDTFAETLEASARKAFPSEPPDQKQITRYLTSLHVEDLALACACAQGSEPAWEHFIREHRPVLYRAADAIDSSGGARDLADSLYGELFGLSERDGERRSHFTYFHGRSSLATWLRAVLSQRHVDRVRTVRRLDPLPEDDAPSAIPSSEAVIDPRWADHVSLMRKTMTATVATLEPRDRLRLRCYYAQDLTLAQIGRMFKESEATASRHLTRIRREIRVAVERTLQNQRMSPAHIAECFAVVVADPGSLDLAEILGSDPGSESDSDPGSDPVPDPVSKKLGQDRSKGKEKSRAVR